ncbi:MAG: OFA family MFS transporter [Thermoanaerobaculaceae bacterium]
MTATDTTKAAPGSGPKTTNRWLIAIMGTMLQLFLGTAYAWSYFQKPLGDAFGWSNSMTAWAFCLAICFLGLAAAWGGMNLAKIGPTKLAMIGGALFGIGYLLGALALSMKSPFMLFLGYGVVGGCGLGLGYVTPVATVAKWFPDKKGFATGLVVMGFGLGALVMSKVFAPMLFNYFKTGVDLVYTNVDGKLVLQNPEALQGILTKLFAGLGVIFTVLTVPVGWFMRNPPAGYVPAGWTPPVVTASAKTAAFDALTAKDCLASGRFFLMWIVFFCNITAGIAIIGFQSPLFQDLWHKVDPTLTAAALASMGATLIGVTSLFNGIGRFFWGGISDKIGRSRTFSIMLGTQIVVFAALAWNKSPWIFAALFCYILLCYGGGFGTMPSFVLDVFGAKLMPVVYGTILTAWSAAGVVGPQMVGIIKDRWPAQAGYYSFLAGLAFVTVGFLITFALSNKPFEKKTAA